jgi:phospholipase/carboxylesterase
MEVEMLPHELYVPEGAGSGTPVLVLLHGRGSHRGDLFTLQRYAPTEWAVVAPDAPFPAAPWGYGAGYAWYQYLGRNRPEPESFRSSLAAVDRLLDALPLLLGAEPGPVALGGFSQGGTVSLGYALTRPGRVANALNLSGFLADHPDVHVTGAPGTRIFWGHGTQDANIPFELAVEGRGLLQGAGADLTALDYDIGHWIDPTEWSDAVAWLREGGL